MFAPKKDYTVTTEKIPLKDFHSYRDNLILRPPYQRKANIWDSKKREVFLDSLCRGYYIPKIVLRDVRFNEDEVKREVIDGQQRITTIIEFYNGNIKLPESLKSMDKDNKLVNKVYRDLDVNKRKWFDENLFLEADIITNIEDKTNPEHLKKASEIFWRLQQGEPLTFMETLHSRLYSSVRNFVTKYADDISYDFNKYQPIEKNNKRHPFFDKILDMPNKRMQHLLLLTRFLIIEFNDGATELKKEKVEEFFEKYQAKDTIHEDDFEKLEYVKRCLKLLNILYEIFKNDSMIDEGNGVKELKVEYFIISIYMFLRHLTNYYAFTKDDYPMFKEFITNFYQRWQKKNSEDNEIMVFRDNRQQSKDNLEMRDQIIRTIFFNEHPKMILKDSKRFFNEYEKIAIYRRDKGLCQMCLKEGKNEEESKVSWSEYDADHIKAWFRGGESKIEQGQVLCKYHNRSKK